MKFERLFARKEIAPEQPLKQDAKKEQSADIGEHPVPPVENDSPVENANKPAEGKGLSSAEIAEEIANQERLNKESYARLFGDGPHIF